MKWFTFTRKYRFPMRNHPELEARDKLNLLKEQCDYAGMDVSIERNTLYFAGNMFNGLFSLKILGFSTNPLSYINGDLDIEIENNQLVVTYNLFFFGQFIFMLVLLLLSMLSIDQNGGFEFFQFAFRLGIIFWFVELAIGIFQFDDIVRKVGYS